VTDESELARYLRCHKEELPEDHVGRFFVALDSSSNDLMVISGSRWSIMAMKMMGVLMVISIMYLEQ
jgi:hypothetical protein